MKDYVMKALFVLMLAFVGVALVGCTSEPETIEVEVPVPYEVEVEVEVEKIVEVEVPAYSENPIVIVGEFGAEFEMKFLEAQTIRIVFAGNQWNMTFTFDGDVYAVDGARTFVFEVEEGNYPVTVDSEDHLNLRYELWFWTLNE